MIKFTKSHIIFGVIAVLLLYIFLSDNGSSSAEGFRQRGKRDPFWLKRWEKSLESNMKNPDFVRKLNIQYDKKKGPMANSKARAMFLKAKQKMKI
jgi:hypothetical protein